MIARPPPGFTLYVNPANIAMGIFLNPYPMRAPGLNKLLQFRRENVLPPAACCVLSERGFPMSNTCKKRSNAPCRSYPIDCCRVSLNSHGFLSGLPLMVALASIPNGMSGDRKPEETETPIYPCNWRLNGCILLTT